MQNNNNNNNNNNNKDYFRLKDRTNNFSKPQNNDERFCRMEKKDSARSWH